MVYKVENMLVLIYMLLLGRPHVCQSSNNIYTITHGKTAIVQKFGFIAPNILGTLYVHTNFKISNYTMHILTYVINHYLANVTFFYTITFAFDQIITYEKYPNYSEFSKYEEWCHRFKNDDAINIILVNSLPNDPAGVTMIGTNCIFIIEKYLLTSLTILHELGHLLFEAPDYYNGSRYNIMYYRITAISASNNIYEFFNISLNNKIKRFHMRDTEFRKRAVPSTCDDFHKSLKYYISKDMEFLNNILLNKKTIKIDASIFSCDVYHTGVKWHVGKYILFNTISGGDFLIKFYLRPCTLKHLGASVNMCSIESSATLYYVLNATLLSHSNFFDNFCSSDKSIGYYCNNYNGICVYDKGIISVNGYVTTKLVCFNMLIDANVQFNNKSKCVVDDVHEITKDVCMYRNGIIQFNN